MSADDDSELARLLPGVKRLRNDRINVYQQRKTTPITRKAAARQPLTPTFRQVHAKVTSTAVCRSSCNARFARVRFVPRRHWICTVTGNLKRWLNWRNSCQRYCIAATA